MKVRASSWHYKIVQWFGPRTDPQALCKYVHRIILNLLLVLLLGLLALAFAPLWVPIFGTWWVLTKIWGANRVEAFLTQDIGFNKDKEPGLIRSYYRAVKNKVCPLIEYDYNG